MIVVRPGGQNPKFVTDVMLFKKAIGHEVIECDDIDGSAEDCTVDEIEKTSRQRPLGNLTHRDHLVGIEVHHPVFDRHAPQGGNDYGSDSAHRW